MDRVDQAGYSTGEAGFGVDTAALPLDETAPSPVYSSGSAEYASDFSGSTVVSQPIQVREIIVRTGRIVVEVTIPDARFRYTTPRLAAFAEGQYPDLPHHACVNDVGFTFGDVIESTSVPHLLEHVVISLQVRERAIGDPTFIGTTEWTDEDAGDARIEFGFQDDLVALRAFNEATRFVNTAVLTCLS